MMIEQATAGEKLAEEKRMAAERKKKQLEDAEKDYQAMVAQEEAEEAAKKKKEEEEAENAALEAARNSPQAKMLAAANDAATQINMNEMEANLQATLQAKLEAGASKSELLAASETQDLSGISAPAQGTLTPQQVVAQVLASKKAELSTAPAFVAKATVPAAQPTAATAQTAEEKASQEKVKEMAQKLGIPFTPELLALGSNSAISDALIEKAVSAGKTEEQINQAMASL